MEKPLVVISESTTCSGPMGHYKAAPCIYKEKGINILYCIYQQNTYA
jgi:hypothetical protein